MEAAHDEARRNAVLNSDKTRGPRGALFAPEAIANDFYGARDKGSAPLNVARYLRQGLFYTRLWRVTSSRHYSGDNMNCSGLRDQLDTRPYTLSLEHTLLGNQQITDFGVQTLSPPDTNYHVLIAWSSFQVQIEQPRNRINKVSFQARK